MPAGTAEYVQSRTPQRPPECHALEAKAAHVRQLSIGFFTEVYRPVVNGVVASVEALAEGLRSRGHQVFCFAPRMPGYREPDGPVFRMPSLPLPARAPYRLTLPLVSRRNVRNVIARLSLVHVHSPFVTGWMGVRYARRYGLPLVYTYHTQLEAYAHYVPFDANATRYAASQLTRTFANLADVVVVPTPAMAARLRDLGVTARIEVVPSGIDLRVFSGGRRDAAWRAQLGVREGDRLVLCVSRLAREKNLELLLEALALTQGMTLALAGDGPLREELEAHASALGVAERTRFLGHVPREQLPDLYASCDLFVMPSTSETQGLVQAEALAAGARVIAVDTPQNRDVLGDAGQLVEPEARALALAMAGPPPDADSQMRALARRAAERFSIDRQLDAMLAIYQELCVPELTANTCSL